MKNTISLLLLLVLTSCNNTMFSSSSPGSQEIDSHGIRAFEFGDKCPRICWLGIQPESTTERDAIRILTASDQIDQQALRISSNLIVVNWFTDATRTYYSTVVLEIERGNIQTLSFYPLHPLILGDFDGIFGEPDEISIMVEEHPHGGTFLTYKVYFNSEQMALIVSPGKSVGPTPNDSIEYLSINLGFVDDEDAPPEYQYYHSRQPWIGYYHLNDYIP